MASLRSSHVPESYHEEDVLLDEDELVELFGVEHVPLVEVPLLEVPLVLEEPLEVSWHSASWLYKTTAKMARAISEYFILA